MTTHSGTGRLNRADVTGGSTLSAIASGTCQATFAGLRIGSSPDRPEGFQLMTRSSMMFATVGVVALAGLAATAPAEARRGFRPGIAVGAAGIAAGVIAGAAIAGAASSYAYAPGYGGYGGYGPGYYYGGPAPYYGGPASYGYSYGGYGGDQSQLGGQPPN